MASFADTIDKAEKIIRGPKSVSVGVDFWGYRYFGLRRSLVPKAEGVIEKINVYANVSDADQDRFIIRLSSWNAVQDKKRWREITHPESIEVTYHLCTSIGNLESIVSPVEKLELPLFQSNPVIWYPYPPIANLFHKRTNQTHLDFSWFVEDQRFFQLTAFFQDAWTSISAVIETKATHACDPDEHW